MKMVYDEWYGEISFAQRAAYRKHNIPPALHDELVAALGDDPAAITKFVKDTAAKQGYVNLRRRLEDAEMTDPEFPITLAALNPDLEYLDAFEIDQDGRGENVWELVTPSGEFLAALTPGAVQLFMRREWLPTLILHTCAEWYANHETT